VRLFVALAVSDEIRHNISALLRELSVADSKVRWLDPRNFHITLKFIGRVPPENLPAITGALAKVQIEHPVQMEFRGLGFFPNARKPIVAWIGTEFSPNLPALAAAINNELAPLEIPREEKPFTPHLTIARFKQTRLSPALLAKIKNLQDRNFGTLTVGEFHLVESTLKSTGAQYTTLRSFPFALDHREGKDL
jgi:2'-5' RNA ligase